MKISVIGAGYVGLTTAACLGHVGHDVFCSESDVDKLDKLQNDVMPLFEPHLKDVIRAARGARRLSFGSTEEAVVWGDAGMKETVIDGETGFLANPYDTEDFAEKLDRVLSDEQLWSKMSREAVRWASKFDWESHIDKLEAALEEAAKR